MCYESLLTGEATDRSLESLRREERTKALRNGLAAGVIVVGALLMDGASPGFTAAFAVAAITLGAALHQALLVVAVLSLRTYRRVAAPGRVAN